MIPELDPERLRRLTERLIALPSVSPDVEAERRCASAIAAELPPGAESGEWLTPDGRPVVWSLLQTRTAETVVLLCHYDTVGVDEFGSLGDPRGTAVAFDPPALRAALSERAQARPHQFPPDVHADLGREAGHPGTWLFGRGALDMKSGVAVGLAAFHAAVAQRPGCSVLFVAAPDEEHRSAGVLAALPELIALAKRRTLNLAGVLNLDYGLEPAAYLGTMGKLRAAAYVLGRPTHAAAPFDGVDASQLVAGLVLRVTRSRELVDRADGARGVPPVALRVRDLKSRYDVQTAAEAVAEFNLMTLARSVDDTMRLLRHEALQALRETSHGQLELRGWLEADGVAHPGEGDLGERVFTYSELSELPELPGLPKLQDGAGAPPGAARLDGGAPVDARDASLKRVRQLVRRAGLIGPAIVLYLLPPYYPHAAPGTSMFTRAVREALAGERGLAVRSYYPLITDASYLAWRAEPPEALSRHMPALGREYRLPVEDARTLDLDVVNLGPWGRDAHGLCERVYAPYAFERLPQLVWNVITRVSELATDREPVA